MNLRNRSKDQGARTREQDTLSAHGLVTCCLSLSLPTVPELQKKEAHKQKKRLLRRDWNVPWENDQICVGSSETIATWIMDACWDDAWNTCKKKRAGRVETVSHGREKTNTVSQDTSEGWEITLDYAFFQPPSVLPRLLQLCSLFGPFCLFVRSSLVLPNPHSFHLVLSLSSFALHQPTNHHHHQLQQQQNRGVGVGQGTAHYFFLYLMAHFVQSCSPQP